MRDDVAVWGGLKFALRQFGATLECAIGAADCAIGATRCAIWAFRAAILQFGAGFLHVVRHSCGLGRFEAVEESLRMSKAILGKQWAFVKTAVGTGDPLVGFESKMRSKASPI